MTLTQRQEQALTLTANGYSIDECAEIMSISRSAVEKLLQKVKLKLGAVNIKHAIYKAAKTGLIMFCIVAVLNADEIRRVNRCGRRELYLPQAVI